MRGDQTPSRGGYVLRYEWHPEKDPDVFGLLHDRWKVDAECSWTVWAKMVAMDTQFTPCPTDELDFVGFRTT